ncbi:glycosyltransferase family 2 protein [Candidatus Woesearchaeota archaeon]|nr:glycosyltransferase family 2 protein [Candidatus Woesearchaeota archaeon]
MKVSIIIPVKNGEATLPFCLQVLSSEHEIIVVNDHSTDDSCRIARQYATKVIDLKDKTGAAAARNAGVAASSGELLVFIDSDIIVRPSRFQRALSEFRKKNYCAAVARYSDSPLKGISRFYNSYMQYKYRSNISDVFCTSFAIISKKKWIPFKETLDCLEDVDLGQELRLSGTRINVLKSLQVTHLKKINLRNFHVTYLSRSRNAMHLSWSYLKRGIRFTDRTVTLDMKLAVALLPLSFLHPLGILMHIIISSRFILFYAQKERTSFVVIGIALYYYALICMWLGIVWGNIEVAMRIPLRTRSPQGATSV